LFLISTEKFHIPFSKRTTRGNVKVVFNITDVSGSNYRNWARSRQFYDSHVLVPVRWMALACVKFFIPFTTDGHTNQPFYKIYQLKIDLTFLWTKKPHVHRERKGEKKVKKLGKSPSLDCHYESETTRTKAIWKVLTCNQEMWSFFLLLFSTPLKEPYFGKTRISQQILLI